MSNRSNNYLYTRKCLLCTCIIAVTFSTRVGTSFERICSFCTSTPPTSVQSSEALKLDNFFETVKAVLVHDLAWHRASLILESCFYKVNRVDRRGTSSWRGGVELSNTLVYSLCFSQHRWIVLAWHFSWFQVTCVSTCTNNFKSNSQNKIQENWPPARPPMENR